MGIKTFLHFESTWVNSGRSVTWTAFAVSARGGCSCCGTSHTSEACDFCCFGSSLACLGCRQDRFGKDFAGSWSPSLSDSEIIIFCGESGQQALVGQVILTSFLCEKSRLPSNWIACDGFVAWNFGCFASESLSPPRAGLSPSALCCVDFRCCF